MTVFHKVFGKNVNSPLFRKGRFKEHQFSLKKISATPFICIIKLHITIIFSFNENKQNSFPYKFLKIFKGPSFHCQKFLDLKPFWDSSNLYELLISTIKAGGLFIRFFAKAVRKFSKSKNEK